MADPLYRAALALARWHEPPVHYYAPGLSWRTHPEHGEELAPMIAVVLHDDACAYGSTDVTKPCEGWRVEELDHDAAYEHIWRSWIRICPVWSVPPRPGEDGPSWPLRRHGTMVWQAEGWARQLAEEGF